MRSSAVTDAGVLVTGLLAAGERIVLTDAKGAPEKDIREALVRQNLTAPYARQRGTKPAAEGA